jgi:hypothetical protein
MEKLKNAGVFALLLGSLILLLVVVGILINGIAWVCENFVSYFIIATHVVAAVCVVVLLPMSLFRATRAIAALGLIISAYLFGLSIWMYGFLVTYNLWGGVGLVVGLLLGIIGVVPLGIFAAAVHSHWWIVGELVYGLALTYAAAMLALWLAARIDMDEEPAAPGIIEGELAS